MSENLYLPESYFNFPITKDHGDYIMKAMILAAGRGTRMQPFTHTLPKPMIPLLRTPVMECIIEHLRHYDITDIIVNTSYLPEAIEDYFRDGDRFGVQMAYSFEGKKEGDKLISKALGSAGGMKRIQEFSGFFDDTFMVLCGDALIDLDIAKVLEFHRKSKSIATIALKEVPWEDVDKYGIVEIDDNGRILQFQEKPERAAAVSNFANTGIYIFEPEVLKYIPDGVEYDIGGELFPKLVEAGLPFFGVSIPFQWVDIGTVPDYAEASLLLLKGEVSNFSMPGKEHAPGVYTGININVDWDNITIVPPVYIGSSTCIEAGAEIIGPVMIGANCHIKAGAVVRETLIHDYTRVSSVANLEQKIVFGNHCIDFNGQALDIQESSIGWLVDDVRRDVDVDEWQKILIDTIESLGSTE